jgi:hypothetical protein
MEISYQYLLHYLLRLIKVEVSVYLFVILPLSQITFFGRSLLFNFARVYSIEWTGSKFV